MLWLKAWHLIFITAWFAGLFYLPRLFVYHCQVHDQQSYRLFATMEWRLYWLIMTPAGILATVFGLWLLMYTAYHTAIWLHLKLTLVLLLWIFHGYCGRALKQFTQEKNTHSQKFYRILNELPTLFLITIVILTVVKPFY